MAWTSPRTWVTGEVVTAAIMNTHVRDNLNATAPAVVTTKGDSVWATAANALARLGVHATNGAVLVANSACNAGVNWTACGVISNTTGEYLNRSAANVSPFTQSRIGLYADGTNWGYLAYGSDAITRLIYGSENNGAFIIGQSTASNNSGCFIGRIAVLSGGEMTIGASANNANMTLGLTINQGANDDEILALKSSDVAHGMTDQAETDTYGDVAKESATAGGLGIGGYTEATAALVARGFSTTTSASRSTTALAAVEILAALKAGTTFGAMTANTNMALIGDTINGARFIFDSDGDLHADAAVTASAYDTHDDSLLVRALERERNPAGLVKSEFDQWVRYNRSDLERMKIATFNDGPGEDGSVFVNVMGLQRLHTGAIWQIYTRMRTLEAQLTERTGSRFGLPGGIVSGSPLWAT